MTPGEILQMVNGRQRREDRQWYRQAWMTSHLLAPWVKDGASVRWTQLVPPNVAKRLLDGD